jgi:hypothetical protein
MNQKRKWRIKVGSMERNKKIEWLWFSLDREFQLINLFIQQDLLEGVTVHDVHGTVAWKSKWLPQNWHRQKIPQPTLKSICSQWSRTSTADTSGIFICLTTRHLKYFYFFYYKTPQVFE